MGLRVRSCSNPVLHLAPFPLAQGGGAVTRKEKQELLRVLLAWGLPLRLSETLSLASHSHAASAASASAASSARPPSAHPLPHLDQLGPEFVASVRARCPSSALSGLAGRWALWESQAL